MLTLVQFGFDRERLYVRLDAGAAGCRICSPTGYEFAVTFLQPDGRPVHVRQTLGRLTGTLSGTGAADGPDLGRARRRRRAVAAGTVLEAGAAAAGPRRDGRRAAGVLRRVYDPGHNEVERHPGSRPIELTVPDERFEARNWSA